MRRLVPGCLLKLICFFLFCSCALAEIKKSDILVTFRPLHSIISNITGDIIVPDLLLKDNHSPHHINVKPSHLGALQKAKIVFYLDKNFETFLRPILKKSKDNKKFISLSSNETFPFLKKSYDSQKDDLHFWLSPDHVIKMLPFIIQKLSVTFPEQKEHFKRNANIFEQELKTLSAIIHNKLRSFPHKKIIVAHDAFTYFEKAFAIHKVMALSDDPHFSFTGKKMIDLEKTISDHKGQAHCLFIDPETKLSHKLKLFFDKQGIRTFLLDPIGIYLPYGKNLHKKILLNITHNFVNCFQNH